MGGEDEVDNKFLIQQNQAIEQFLNYYLALPKEQIPEAINKVFDKIIKPNNSVVAVQCVDILQKDLRGLVNAHQKILGSIALHNKEQLGEQRLKAALEKAQEALKQAQATLEKALSSQPLTYQGKDQAGLTTTLLQALGVSFTIQADRDLETLHASSPQDIGVLLKGKEESWVQNIGDIPNLALFLATTSTDRAAAVLKAAGPYLVGEGKLVSFSSTIGTLLIPLLPDACFVMLQALKDQLLPDQGQGIIAKTSHFQDVLEHLDPAQRTAVYRAWEDKLSPRSDKTLIKDARDFRAVLHYLPEAQCTAVYEAWAEKLSPHSTPNQKLITSANDFQDVLCYLPEAQRTAVYTVWKDILLNPNHPRQWIKHAEDLSKVLYCLSPAQCTAVCGAWKDQNLIKDAKDLSTVLRDLTEEQRTALYEAWKKELPRILTTDDLSLLEAYLLPDQVNELRRELPSPTRLSRR